MAALEVLLYPHPVLTTPAEAVAVVDDEITQLCEDMAETMYAEGGVGLAAPQVGVSKQILVMDCDDPESGPGLMAFINPEIVEAQGTILWEEGCLSFPGLTAEVERSAEIVVRAFDARGQAFEAELSGLPSVCVQHEMDHLAGLTVLDRLSPFRRKRALARWTKLRAQLEEERQSSR